MCIVCADPHPPPHLTGLRLGLNQTKPGIPAAIIIRLCVGSAVRTQLGEYHCLVHELRLDSAWFLAWVEQLSQRGFLHSQQVCRVFLLPCCLLAA